MKNDIEINELLSRFLAGEAMPEEAMMLEDWIEASPANQLIYNNAVRIFESPEMVNQNETKQKAWEKIRASIKNNRETKKVKPIRTWMAVAASVALLITVGTVIRYYFNRHDSLIYSATSMPKTVQLSDSSEITIAPRSIITVDKEFGKSNRNIKLEGSASFSVKHDSAKPLIITVNTFYVKDVGTKFTITTSANADTIYVSVQEGEVLVYDNNRSVASLIANEKARYIKSIKKLDAYKNIRQLINTGSNPKKALFENPISENSNRNTSIRIETLPKRNISTKVDTTKGAVLFECSICGEKGNLLFVLLPGNIPNASGFLFYKEAGSTNYKHKEQLSPGEYKWYFSDYGNLKTEGKVIIKRNDEVKIKLFEK
ncbi:MAG: FecR family protein [Ferruginibacter sp.]